MELIISLMGATVAILVSFLGAYFANRNSIILQTRKLKEDHYIAYVEALHNFATDNSNQEYHKKYTFYRDKLLLIASKKVIIALLNFEINMHNDTNNKYMSLLIKAIRSDLKLSNYKLPILSLIK